MKRNIVAVGLKYDDNLGDQAIYYTTTEMLKEFILGHGLDIALDTIDLYGAVKFRSERNVMEKASEKLQRLFMSADDLREKKVRKLCRKYIGKNTAAIVFTGGGIVKYKYQLAFFRAINAVTEYAERFHVPVMMSAVGIEGYDEQNEDCRNLKKALNRSCVKVITTRDDLEILNKYYKSTDMKTAKVADPACSISEYLQVSAEKTHTIGLGVVREGLFIDNEVPYSKEQLLELYAGLYHRIVKDGYGCAVYTNGLKSDQRFAADLKEYTERRYHMECRVLKRPEHVEDLVKYICGFDGLICGRLHSSILAYSYGVPSVGLVWNRKQSLFGETVGYPERFVNAGDFSVDNIASKLYNAVGEGYSAIDKPSYIQTTKQELFDFLNNYVDAG